MRLIKKYIFYSYIKMRCHLCKENQMEFRDKYDLKRHFKQKNHLENFNTEQKEYINGIYTLLDEKKPKTLLLNCPGGTGKSYSTINNILLIDYDVIILTPTNQSKNILKKMLQKIPQDNRNKNIYVKTLHSYFEWSQENDEDDNLYDIFLFEKKSLPKNNTLYIIDEISMINEDLYQLIDFYILGSYKCILMGDEAQLAGIEDTKKKQSLFKFNYVRTEPKHISKLFYREDERFKYNLTHIMRTENVYLSNINMAFREDIIKNREINSKLLMNSYLKDIKSNIFNTYLEDNLLLEFAESNEKIFISYRNCEKTKLNKRSQELLGYTQEYNVGEKIIINDYIHRETEDKKGTKIFLSALQNGDKEIIKRINITRHIFKNIIPSDKTFKINKWVLGLGEDEKQVEKIISRWYLKSDYVILCNYKKYFKDLIKDILDPKERKQLYKELRLEIKSVNMKFDLGYAITTHKSQGAGFDEVCVLLKDLRLAQYFNPDTFKRLYYTAISRTKNKLYINW